ncbi:LOW QUALITY PROTEIN: SRSO17 transposase [Streptomyces sp. TLI_235]|nr:LOW QUALITY PROTEIN: SRSO17 transposase [Streptomyces sp. TLI_235]
MAAATVAYEQHRERFEGLMGRVAGVFPRRETRGTFREMTQGLLTELEDVNCRTLAEAVGHPGPHRLQHLLSRAVWDEGAVLDRAAAWAVEALDDGDGVLIADETGDEKSSTDAVGAGPQYSGALGGLGVCQVAVHLTFATGLGHTVIGRALYLPKDWAADEERRELAGVPDEVGFATKPELAAALLTKAVEAGVRATFFAADEVYGPRHLRQTCRTLGLGYAVAVRSNHRVTTPARAMTCKDALKLIPARAWQRMRTGTGSKGARDYDWAMLEVTADDVPDGQPDEGVSVLLARRHRYTRVVSFFRCWSPTPVPLARLVQVVCRRWAIEEDFQTAKAIAGLDKGQVTGWTSWHRWSTAALVAYAFLAVATALERAHHPGDRVELIALTCPELLRLLRLLVLPPRRRDIEHVLHWSTWRRHHQYRARTCHLNWHAYADTTP